VALLRLDFSRREPRRAIPPAKGPLTLELDAASLLSRRRPDCANVTFGSRATVRGFNPKREHHCPSRRGQRRGRSSFAAQVERGLARPCRQVDGSCWPRAAPPTALAALSAAAPAMMPAAPKSFSESVLRAAEPLAPLEGGSVRGVLAGGGMPRRSRAWIASSVAFRAKSDEYRHQPVRLVAQEIYQELEGLERGGRERASHPSGSNNSSSQPYDPSTVSILIVLEWDGGIWLRVLKWVCL
jgi:hypothetical protein